MNDRDVLSEIAERLANNPSAVCYVCGMPATCVGLYENALAPELSCDEHCGHGCEDGRCERIERRES